MSAKNLESDPHLRQVDRTAITTSGPAVVRALMELVQEEERALEKLSLAIGNQDDAEIVHCAKLVIAKRDSQTALIAP